MTSNLRPTALAAIVATAGIAGCSTPPPPPTSFVFFYPALTTAGLVAIAIPPTVALPHGPSITVVNRADVPVDVRIWTAMVDVSKPAGYRDQQTADRLALHVEPNQLYFLDAGRPGWVTGMNDAIVWIRFAPSPEGQDSAIEPIWIQFDRPGPYKIEVAGAFDPNAPRAGLDFYPLEDTTFSPLPRSLWIEHHDGKYAVSD